MKLLFAPMANGKAFSEECYFLSTSEEDQMINAWYDFFGLLAIVITPKLISKVCLGQYSA